MAELTKQAIISAFIELLNTRPLDQITVTDIARKCGISRRTYYHYYQDIYQLPEEIFLAETTKILKDRTDFRSWEDWFVRMMEFAFKNKRAISHIYHSVRREYLERYIFSVADRTLTDYIAKQAEDSGCTQEAVDMLAAFYTSAVVGLSLDWIRSGMKEEPQAVIEKYVHLLEGTIHHALSNCTQGGVEPAPVRAGGAR